jgi:hypothetical protein
MYSQGFVIILDINRIMLYTKGCFSALFFLNLCIWYHQPGYPGIPSDSDQDLSWNIPDLHMMGGTLQRYSRAWRIVIASGHGQYYRILLVPGCFLSLSWLLPQIFWNVSFNGAYRWLMNQIIFSFILSWIEIAKKIEKWIKGGKFNSLSISNKNFCRLNW